MRNRKRRQNKIKRLRIESKMLQEDVLALLKEAKAVNPKIAATRASLSRWENNHANPYKETGMVLVDIFGLMEHDDLYITD